MAVFKPEGTKFLEWESSSSLFLFSSTQKQMLEKPLNIVADKEYYISTLLSSIGNQLCQGKSIWPSSLGHRSYLSSPRSQLWWILVPLEKHTPAVSSLVWLSSSQLTEKDIEGENQLA